MCTRPIKILNPKLRAKLSTFNKDIDSTYIYVPCGRCEECKNQKRNDWIIRLAYEYQNTIDQGGFCLFETFTYNDTNLPKMFGKWCFNKEHYKTFMKKLRTYLDRHFLSVIPNLMANMYSPSVGETLYSRKCMKERDKIVEEMRELYPEYEPRNNVKVFWVSEYGSEFGRPHYHAIFFVTMKITPYDFREYIRKAWIYGFTDKRVIEQQVVHGYEGIYYCTKYVNKTTNEFLQKFAVTKDTYNEIQKAWYSMTGEEIDWDAFCIAPMKRINEVLTRLNLQGSMPFMRVSQGLGKIGINKITEEEWKEGVCKKIEKKKGYKLVRIPEYYKRKYMYDYDKISNTFSLNDRGILLKKQWAEQAYTRNIIQTDVIMNQLAEEFIKELESDYCNYDYFKAVWTTYCNQKGLSKFVDLLCARDMIAQKAIMEEVVQGQFPWVRITNNAQAWCKYSIGQYINRISHEADWIAHTYAVHYGLIEHKVSDTEKYLLKMYDKIKSKHLQKRAEYLHKLAIEAERQKQIKNNQKPNVT